MEQLQFSIQSLLSKRNGRIYAPTSPGLFANEMMQQLNSRYNRLARLWFEDETIFQRHEDGGLTGFDILIIGCQYPEHLWISLWVDEGVGGMPVAMAFEGYSPECSPVYRQSEYARRLSKSEIDLVFDYIFQHPRLLDIIEQ